MDIFNTGLTITYKADNLQGIAKSLFTLPTVGMPTQSILDSAILPQNVMRALETVGLARGIPIFASSQKEVGKNNIGDQILLRSSELGTSVVTDNIAPLPRTWEIKGYISPTQNILETNIPGMYEVYCSGVIVALQAIKNYFRYLRLIRAPFKFTTRMGETINVLMEDYEFTDEPESEWATAITLRLREYIALSVAGNGIGYDLNMPDAGSLFGASAQYTSAGTKAISNVLKQFI